MRTVLFFPGFGEHISSRKYRDTISAIKSKGYEVKFVPINWKYTTIDQWVEEAARVYSKFKPGDTILAGFSFGAMTAFALAALITPRALWLFSLSSYFSEDLRHVEKKWLEYLGKKRIAAFRRFVFGSLVKKIHCRTLIFLGEHEAKTYPQMLKRATDANNKIKQAKLIMVPDCHHDVCDAKYIQSIRKSI